MTDNTEPFSRVSLDYYTVDETGSQTIHYEINGDPLLNEMLRKIEQFLRGMGYGVDELVAKVDVQGETIEHSSEDFA